MNFEQNPQSLETQEKPSSKIEMRFFRHDEKEADKSKPEADLQLTPEGKMHAKGLAEDDDINQSVAFGSFVNRAQETAAYVMAGATDDIIGTESLAELKSKLNENLGYGSKVNIDKRLAINLDNGLYGQKFIEAYKQEKLLKFLVNESDNLAKELEDVSGASYSHMASQIAQIVKKYSIIAARFNELVTEQPDKYKPEMKRFFGSHQGFLECFPAKVIELTKGVEERNKFIEAVGNNGFGYGEGFDCDIAVMDDGEHIRIRYTKEGQTPEKSFVFDEEIPLEIIDQIIGENK